MSTRPARHAFRTLAEGIAPRYPTCLLSVHPVRVAVLVAAGEPASSSAKGMLVAVRGRSRSKHGGLQRVNTASGPGLLRRNNANREGAVHRAYGDYSTTTRVERQPCVIAMLLYAPVLDTPPRAEARLHRLCPPPIAAVQPRAGRQLIGCQTSATACQPPLGASGKSSMPRIVPACLVCVSHPEPPVSTGSEAPRPQGRDRKRTDSATHRCSCRLPDCSAVQRQAPCWRV